MPIVQYYRPNNIASVGNHFDNFIYKLNELSGLSIYVLLIYACNRKGSSIHKWIQRTLLLFIYCIYILITRSNVLKPTTRMVSRAYSNKLPLALKPFAIVSHTHLLKMMVQLLLCHRFSEWISYIIR